MVVFVFFLLLIGTLPIQAKTKYKIFDMAPTDIAAVLQDIFVHESSALTNSPADICFGCADIKYDHGSFKIVECGDGIYMSLRATDVIMNNKLHNLVSPFWGLLWHHLCQFGLPIWHVDSVSDKNAIAINEHKKLGIHYAPSFAALAKNKLFQATISKTKELSTNIADYAGIIVFAAPQAKERERDGSVYKTFQKKYPQFIYVNGTTRHYLKRKDHTYRLFHQAGLDAFIPRFGIFSTTYNRQMAQQITALFPDSNLLVIKPTYSSLSIGVNIIKTKNLESLLRLILQRKDSIPEGSHRSLTFWRYTKQPEFVASEYVPSETIYKNNNPYDPTMRVIYIMYHDQGTIRVNVLGGFWKIPVKPLNDPTASETDKHVTIAHAGDYFSGILLEHEESLRMKRVLAPVLAKAYEQMLVNTHA